MLRRSSLVQRRIPLAKQHRPLAHGRISTGLRSSGALLLGLLLAAGGILAQDRILAVLQQRLAANPRDAHALEELGVEFLRRGEVTRAFIQLHKSLAVAPERGTPYFYLGLVYFEKGLTFKEIEAYQKAIFRAPEFLPARLNLAHAYLSVGRIREAVEQYRWVEARQPTNLAVIYNLGIVFADLNRPDEARAYLERYLRLAPATNAGRERAAGVLAELDGRR